MTQKIKEQILAVRKSGLTNMFDINGVQWAADKLGLYDLVVFLIDEQGRDEYKHLLMTGKTDIEEEGDDE